MRWRARRESIYIRCSPSTLLQQCERGMLDVRMVTPRPGRRILSSSSSTGRVVAAPAGPRDLLVSREYVRRGTACDL